MEVDDDDVGVVGGEVRDNLGALEEKLARVEADIKETEGKWESAGVDSVRQHYENKLQRLAKREEALRAEKQLLLQQRQGRMSTVDCVV